MQDTPLGMFENRSEKTVARFLTGIMLAGLVLLSCVREIPEPGAWTPAILSGSSIYLPDFSYAGYQWGEADYPEYENILAVTDFGAIANDPTDDSDAVIAAIAAAAKIEQPVTIRFPAGTFIISKIIQITHSNVLLQGAGSSPEGTVLSMPLPMSKMPLPGKMTELTEYLHLNNKRVKSGQLFSPYSWTGGIIWPGIPGKRTSSYLMEYDRPPVVAAKIVDGKAGQHSFRSSEDAALQAGQLYTIHWYNTEGPGSTLLKALYSADRIDIGARNWESPQRPLIQQTVSVTKVENGIVTIKEPLLHDLKPDWGCILVPADMLRGIGIEGFRIAFPEVPYGGHHLEDGYNAIYLTSLAHSWIRDVHFVNADNGILSDDCANISIENVVFSGRRSHYSIHFGKVNHMLAKNIDILSETEHSLSFNTYCKASVFSNANIRQTPTLDQHNGSNHQNLFDNIHASISAPPLTLLRHGGAGYWKPTHGNYNTFWNIQLTIDFLPESVPVAIPGIDDGPNARIVGMSGNYPLTLDYGPEAYFEGMNATDIKIPSLYEFQLKQRLSGD